MNQSKDVTSDDKHNNANLKLSTLISAPCPSRTSRLETEYYVPIICYQADKSPSP